MLGQPHRHFSTIDSTNEAAYQWAHAGATHGSLVTAGTQTAGRGRRGRSWSSPAGKGLYFSLILRPDLAASQTPQFTILAALATANSVEQQTGLRPQTKWPNDVLLHGRKIAGILSEAHLDNGRLDFVVIGVGLNVNHESGELPPRPLFPASSLLLEGRPWPLETMLQAWLQEMDELWSVYVAGEWASLRAEFENRCAGLGSGVSVALENETYQGVAIGIDDDGLLLVQTASEVRRVVAGDVTFTSAAS